MEARLSSDELDAKALVGILFEAYSPPGYPRTVDSGSHNGAPWLLMYDARKNADGFFLIPESSAREEDRIWIDAPAASQAISTGEPLFLAFAKVSSLPVGAAPTISNPSSDRSTFIDVLTTKLGSVSLEFLESGFHLRVSHRNGMETGGVTRRRNTASEPISSQDLALGIEKGLSPLRAACEHHAEAVRALFPSDQVLEANAVREVLRRETGDEAGGVAPSPKKPGGL